MLRRKFVTADTHFGHKNIIKYEAVRNHFSSIEEHDQALVDNWNSVVGPDDIVYHLGDVAFGRIDVVGQLNGIKHLVLGNHDSVDILKYLEYFKTVNAMIKLHDVILTHIPIHPSQFSRFRLNVHGHLHSKQIYDLRYINASIENHGLKPILLDKLIG